MVLCSNCTGYKRCIAHYINVEGFQQLLHSVRWSNSAIHPLHMADMASSWNYGSRIPFYCFINSFLKSNYWNSCSPYSFCYWCDPYHIHPWFGWVTAQSTALCCGISIFHIALWILKIINGVIKCQLLHSNIKI